MKIAFLLSAVLLSTMNLLGQNSFKLPEKWEEMFVISVSHTGSMSGANSHLTFTHDSCKYVATSQHAKPEEKIFALSQKDRDAILSKMRELKIDRIKTEHSMVPQHDGWSNVLCAGTYCIEGGSASQMSQKDKDAFLDACRYLEDFALNR